VTGAWTSQPVDNRVGHARSDLRWQQQYTWRRRRARRNPGHSILHVQNPTTISQNQYNGRLDADVTQKDRLAFAIYWVPTSTSNFNGPARPQNLWHHSQINDAFSLIWNHTFSPTLINQARANAAGWRWNEVTSNPQAPLDCRRTISRTPAAPALAFSALRAEQSEPVDLHLQ